MALTTNEIEELCRAAEDAYGWPTGVRVPRSEQVDPAPPTISTTKAWGRPIVRRLPGRNAILLELKDSRGPVFVLARGGPRPLPQVAVRFLIGTLVAVVAPPARPVIAPALAAASARARGKLRVVSLGEAVRLARQAEPSR